MFFCLDTVQINEDDINIETINTTRTVPWRVFILMNSVLLRGLKCDEANIPSAQRWYAQSMAQIEKKYSSLKYKLKTTSRETQCRRDI